MAQPMCGSCKARASFEIKEYRPHGSDYAIMLVQCASCGAVVGIHEMLNIGSLILEQNRAIQEIATKVEASVKLRLK